MDATEKKAHLVRKSCGRPRMWPDDGGLKEPVRSFESTFSVWDLFKEMIEKNKQGELNFDQ